MDIFSGLLSGFQVIFQPVHLFYCFLGVFVGTLIGVLPGIGPVGAMSILLPTTFGVSPVAGYRDAGGNLLRGHVRGVHHFDSGEYSWRGRLGRYLPGRIPDGPQGKSGPRPRNVRPGLIHRRDLQHHRSHVSGLAPIRGCREVRTAGIFLPHVHGTGRGDLSCQRISVQGFGHGNPRSDPRRCGHGSHIGEIAFHAWAFPISPTGSIWFPWQWGFLAYRKF